MGTSTKEEQTRVKSLLLDTVSLLCKNGLTFKKQMKIQGLLGITLDEEDVFIVHINEAVGDALDASKRTERTSSRECSSGRTPEKSSTRKRGAASSPATRGPPDKRQAGGDVIVIVEDDKNKLDKKPLITNVRGGLPPNHPLTPQKYPGMRAPGMASPNRMPYVRVVGSPNQRGGMISPQRMNYRGRPPMHALRCPYCGSHFPNQMTMMQHVQEVHKHMMPPGQQIGQMRPLGLPLPAGVSVKRNLYSSQPQLVVRKNRHDNNSNAPIAIDASPPPGSKTTDTSVEPRLGPPTGSATSETQANPTVAEYASETTTQKDNTRSSSVDGQDGVENMKESDDVDASNQPASDSVGVLQAGSDKSESLSRPASVSKASDGSESDGYLPNTPADKISTRPPSGRDSVASGMSESEMTSRSPGDVENVLGQAPVKSDLSHEEKTSVESQHSTETDAKSVKAITIAPELAEPVSSGRKSANIFSQLEIMCAETALVPPLTTKPVTRSASNAASVATIGQITIVPRNATPAHPQASVSTRAMEIKPEGPFGSEIMGAGGQQMFETQNQPNVFLNEPSASVQITNIVSVGSAGAQPRNIDPNNVQMRFAAGIRQPVPPNMQNPFIQHQQAFIPPRNNGPNQGFLPPRGNVPNQGVLPPNSYRPPRPFGGRDYNGFL